MYGAPSSFSLAAKRRLNPRRTSDDGWVSVKYRGHSLSFYKTKLLKQASEPHSNINSNVATNSTYGNHNADLASGEGGGEEEADARSGGDTRE